MKNAIILFVICFSSAISWAQAPDKLSYQAVIRDNGNNLLQNETIGLQIEIHQGTLVNPAIYSEFHTIGTNENGLISAEIGNGTTSDDFSSISWENGPFFIKTQIDPEGGNNFTITGVKELLSVPYALYSKHANTVDQVAFDGWDKTEADDFSGDYNDLANKPTEVGDFNNDAGYLTKEVDPHYSSAVAAGITADDTAMWNAKIAEEVDPIFTASVAASITEDNTAYWNTLIPLGEEGNLLTHDGNNWVAKDLILTTNNTGGGQSFNNMQPYLTIRFCIALVGLYPTRNSANPFIGEIQMFAFNFAPRNFADCNGQLLSISQNTALFSLVGTMYGGDGRTTFGIPDLRGRVPIHLGQGSGLSNHSQGQRSGTENTSLNTTNIPSHNHTINISYEE